MKLLNVRLDAAHIRMVADLRRCGIEMSTLVREAIRAAHGRRSAADAQGRRPSQLLAEIYRECPDPDGVPRPMYDLRDRRSVQRAIRRRLRRSKP
jgi:hypothetical protein